jgi:electron transfer flavoprotein alpha subunit
MIKRADLSVIGESAEILHALIDAVAAYRNDAKRDAA